MQYLPFHPHLNLVVQVISSVENVPRLGTLHKNIEQRYQNQ